MYYIENPKCYVEILMSDTGKRLHYAGSDKRLARRRSSVPRRPVQSFAGAVRLSVFSALADFLSSYIRQVSFCFCCSM